PPRSGGHTGEIRERPSLQLRPDGEAYTADDLFGEEGESGLTFSPAGEWPPATYTIWVHPARRGEGFGGQLVRAVAAHYDLPLSKLCFRLRFRSKRCEWCSDSA